MKRPSRDTWLAIGLLAILVLLTVAAALRQTQDKEPSPLSSTSNAADGGRALRLWLERIGFEVLELEGAEFRIPEGATLLLILEPRTSIRSAEWELIDQWVQDGGTLILAGSSFGTALAIRHYDFGLAYLDTPQEQLIPQSPVLTSPPQEVAPKVKNSAYFTTQRDDFLIHLGVTVGSPDGEPKTEEPVLVSFSEGQGKVILSATAYPFTNAGLKEAGNPGLVLNLVALVGSSVIDSTRNDEPPAVLKRAWFDEWHHGVRVQREVIGPQDWLRYTPAGQAILLTVGIFLVALLLQGRRFGRPIPLNQETNRRGPLEYLTAMANLNRRAGHRATVLEQYHQRLKRELGHRYRLEPTLPDEQYVAHLAQLRPNLDTAALSSLLKRLSKPVISENEMVQLARETSTWLDETYK